jgi:hypothetical protein
MSPKRESSIKHDPQTCTGKKNGIPSGGYPSAIRDALIT